MYIKSEIEAEAVEGDESFAYFYCCLLLLASSKEFYRKMLRF